VYASYSSKSERLFSSANVAAASTLCSFSDRRVVRSSGRRLITVKCNLEKTVNETGACRRRDFRLQCSRVAAAEASPSRIEDLESRFGQAGLRLPEAAGCGISEMRLKEGSSARIVLQSALVTSYKSRMSRCPEWMHRGMEWMNRGMEWMELLGFGA
jgi:hypothetical protein